MTYPTATEGRRRADAPAVQIDARAIDAIERAGRDPQAPRPVEDAFAFTADRMDRLEHMLGSVQATIQRLGSRVEPFLTDGTYGYPDAPVDADVDPTPEDRRSTIAKRVSGLGIRADRLADFTVRLEREVESILDAMEV